MTRCTFTLLRSDNKHVNIEVWVRTPEAALLSLMSNVLRKLQGIGRAQESSAEGPELKIPTESTNDLQN